MTCKPSTPATSGGCDPCSPARRNRYFKDKRLHVADYVLEQEYLIGRRRAINRAMLGWGVAEGYALDLEGTRLTIGGGFALDRHGRELIACEPAEITGPGDVIWLEPESDCGPTIGEPPKPPEPDQAQDACDTPENPDCANLYLLRAHYAERQVDPVRIEEDCGGARREASHVCETVVFSLQPVDCCPSALPRCRGLVCGGEAGCSCDAWDDDDRDRPFRPDRGPHRQLASWSAQTRGGLCDDGRPRDKAGCLAVDLGAGVPLACVRIGFACDEAHIAAVVDALASRRLAYPAPRLFDLLRGCDLVRIADVSWRDWLAGDNPVPFSRFAAMFIRPSPASMQGLSKKQKLHAPADTKLTVRFSGPVQVRTLTSDAVTITLVQRQAKETIGEVFRVPIVALKPETTHPGDDEGTTRGFTVQIAAGFYNGELDEGDASGFEKPTTVEIEVRCEFLSDCNGQSPTGGGRQVPSSGTVPGQRFLSSFVVVPDDEMNDASGQAGQALEQEV